MTEELLDRLKRLMEAWHKEPPEIRIIKSDRDFILQPISILELTKKLPPVRTPSL